MALVLGSALNGAGTGQRLINIRIPRLRRRKRNTLDSFQETQMGRRTQRVASLIRDTIGQVILTQLSDPRIDPALTSIINVEVPEDLLTAKVCVSIMGDEATQRKTLRALNHASGRVQELMMRKISLRNTPRLRFELDEKFAKTLQTFNMIEKAMQDIREKDQTNEETLEEPAD